MAAKARGDVDASVNILEAFINEVKAQRGKTIPVSAADYLIDFASQVIIAAHLYNAKIMANGRAGWNA